MLDLLGEMFSDAGGKIKTIALIMFALIWASGIIWGIAVFIDESPLGLLISLFSILPAYLMALPLYAFGQLVQNSDEVNYRVYELREALEEKE